MVWRLFATKLETAETMEGVAINMWAPYFYPAATQKYVLSKQIKRKAARGLYASWFLGGDGQLQAGSISEQNL